MLLYNTKKVLAVSAGHFFHDIFTSFIAAIAFLLKERYQLSYFDITLMVIISKLPGALNPLISYFVERIGAKFFIILTPFLTALFIVAIGLISNFYLLLLTLFLAGVSAQAFHVPAPVIIKKLSTDTIGRNMSFFQMGGEAARTIGPIIIMTFLLYFSLEQLYFLLPIGIFASIMLALSLKPIFKDITIQPISLSIRESFAKLLAKKELLYTIMAIAICKGLTASTVIALLSTFLKEQGVTNFLSGSSLSLIAFAGFLGVSFSGIISDRIGRTKFIFLYLLLSPIALFLFLISPPQLLSISIFLLGAIATSITPVIMTYVQEKAADIPSFSNGIYMTSNFMLTSLIVLLMGQIADFTSIYQTLWVSCALSLLPFLFLMAKFKLSVN